MNRKFFMKKKKYSVPTIDDWQLQQTKVAF